MKWPTPLSLALIREYLLYSSPAKFALCLRYVICSRCCCCCSG